MSDGPTPGWYPDPEGTGQLRWWDGRQWTASYRAPMAQALPPTPTRWAGSGRFRPVSDWFGHVFGLLGDRIGHLFTIASITLLPFSALSFVGLWQAFDGVDIVLTDDETEIIGWSTSSTTAAVIAAVLLSIGTLWFTTAGQHQLWAAAIERPSPWSRSVTRGLVALPRLLGWSLVLTLLFGAVLFVTVLLAVAVSPVVLVLLVPALLVGGIWLMVHVQFVLVSVVSTRENALAAGFAIARGRWMAAFGRTILTWLVATAASLAFAFVGQIVSVIAGAGSGDAITSSGGVDVLHLGDLYPNVGAAIVFGIVTALQSGASQAVTMASLASLYVDAGGASDPDRAGDGSTSGSSPAAAV